MRMSNARKMQRRVSPGRSVPTNVSLDAALVAEARELGVNISKASLAGLEMAVAKARRERWLQENAAALEGWNDYVEANGLPLSGLRQF
jgi:antitoxin CcdA